MHEGVRAGIYLVHKPAGVTSFSLVQELMERIRLLGLRKDKLPVCHGGALDPFAEGLLLLLTGPATRLMEELHPIPKRYVARVAWGRETDNGDLLGRTTLEADASALTPARLDAPLAAFLGWREQVPPATSNKRVGGERAYEKAHRGEDVVLPPSRVYLHEARWVSHELPASSTLELVCRGGYYVRALARDLSRALGCGAHLASLRRTAIGPWQDPAEPVLLTGAGILPWCASRELSERELRAVIGREGIAAGELVPPAWPLPEGFPPGPVRALREGKLVALLQQNGRNDGTLTTRTLLGNGL
jgi:tRNA pseudouridine55 synthase